MILQIVRPIEQLRRKNGRNYISKYWVLQLNRCNFGNNQYLLVMSTVILSYGLKLSKHIKYRISGACNFSIIAVKAAKSNLRGSFYKISVAF